MPAPVTYLAGHVKHNPENGSVAIRTIFSEVDFPEMVWLVATLNQGALTKPLDYVEGWDDLFVPEPPPAPPAPPVPPNPPPL